MFFPDLREQHGKEDMRLRGKIQRVVLRGVDVFLDGYVIADTPTGQVIYSAVDKAPPLIMISRETDASRPRLFSMVRSRSTIEKGASGYEEEALSAFPMFDKHFEAARNRLDSQGRRRASAADLGRSQASSQRSSLQVPASTASRSGSDLVLNTKQTPMTTSMRRPSLFLSPSFENLSSRRVSLVSVPTDAPKKLPFLHVVSAEDFCEVDVKNLMVCYRFRVLFYRLIVCVYVIERDFSCRNLRSTSSRHPKRTVQLETFCVGKSWSLWFMGMTL